MENQEIYDKMMDKSFQKGLKQNPEKYAREFGYEVTNDTSVKVLENTKDVFYVIIPLEPKQNINLDQIQAAGNTVGSVGTSGTVCTFCSTASTTGTASTAGSA